MVAAAVLLKTLRAQGVAFEVVGSRLRAHDPRGVITPELAEEVRAAKPEIIALLAPPVTASAACLDCGVAIGSRYVRCVPCARGWVAQRPDLLEPCPECRAMRWAYDTVDLRRCVGCGHIVELPLVDRDPLSVIEDDDGLASWETCACDRMPAGQTCRACAARAVARYKAAHTEE
ncbi:MAG: hypothetical protein ACR2HN_03765 [Tepidiformaceae bacterium]